MKKELAAVIVLIIAGIGLMNLNTLGGLFFFPQIEKKDFYCYKNSLTEFPYWYECNAKKVTQTVPNELYSIENFTVLPEEKRVFWEFRDSQGISFYSNNIAADSMTLLSRTPENGGKIKEFSSENTGFIDILRKTGTLVYSVEKKDAEGNVLSEKTFAVNITGGQTKEIMQEQNSEKKAECIGFENNRLFWVLEENQKTGLYYSNLESGEIKLASYQAEACNPKNSPGTSSKISPAFGCPDQGFYSKGNFVFWKLEESWNYEDCNANSTIETINATYFGDNYIKVITQHARKQKGEYFRIFENGIDLQGNRLAWIFYSNDTKKEALYYNCLKGYGEPRIIEASLEKATENIAIEENTISWIFEGKAYSAQMQECPN